MHAQNNKYVETLATTFSERDVLMDAAYKELVEFVDDLLEYESGADEIGDRGDSSLPRVVACFQALAEYCEQIIVGENHEAVEAMQETGEASAAIGSIQALKVRMLSDGTELDKAVLAANEVFNITHGHHEDAKQALTNGRDKQNVSFLLKPT